MQRGREIQDQESRSKIWNGDPRSGMAVHRPCQALRTEERWAAVAGKAAISRSTVWNLSPESGP